MNDYESFLREFNSPPFEHTRWSHLRAFDGGLCADITTRNHPGRETMTVVARSPEMFRQELTVAVNIADNLDGTGRPSSDIIEAAGIDRERVLDLLTGNRVQDWHDAMVADQLRAAFDRWFHLKTASLAILVRAPFADMKTAGDRVARSVPPSMRLATPILVVTEWVADEVDRLLDEYGIAPMAENSVVLLAHDGVHIVQRHRLPLHGNERSLTSSIGDALAWIGSKNDDIQKLIASVIDLNDDDDDGDELVVLRTALAQSQSRERALAVTLRNARVELKQANGQRWTLERQLGMFRDDDTVTDRPEPELPALPETAPPPAWNLPILLENTFAAMLPRARQKFTNVVIDESIDKVILPLDSHPKRNIWLLRAWTSLALLDHYADAKREGDASGSFRAWLETNPHSLIQPVHVRSGETASMQTGKYREARTFAVPGSVDPTGRTLFLTHIHIEPGKVRPNPRLHFLDDTAPGGSAMIYVGHLGPHLTTRRTN